LHNLNIAENIIYQNNITANFYQFCMLRPPRTTNIGTIFSEIDL